MFTFCDKSCSKCSANEVNNCYAFLGHDALSTSSNDKTEMSDASTAAKMQPRGSESVEKITSESAFVAQHDRDDFIVHMHRDGRHYVSCYACRSHPDVVRIHSHKGRLPAIATVEGTIFRQALVSDHIASPWHSAAKKCHRLTKISKVEVAQQGPLDRHVSKANEALANKVGSLMVSVYNDAKRLTLSGYSWPSRMVASQIAQCFQFNDAHIKSDDQHFDLQYISPNSHSTFLKCIVAAHAGQVLDTLLQSRAISLRLDGSVDRAQIDKIYVLAKCVTCKGDTQEFFIGLAEPDQRGAVGILNAVKESLITNFGTDGIKVLRRITSIVTDGASVNIGDKNGLWTLLQAEIEHMAQVEADNNISSETESLPVLPLLKVWCAVHRSQLAWHSVSESVFEVKHIFQNLISIVSFFHTSGVRTRELKAVADDNHLNLVSLPRVFEIRWTEFSYSLLTAVLSSWQAIVTYLTKSPDASAKGHMRFLTSLSNLKLLTFLADVLFLFSRFQMRLQSDSTTLLDMQAAVTNVHARIVELTHKPLVGGWQEALTESVTESNEEVFLKGIRLQPDKPRRRDKHHLFVSDKRDSTAVCNEIAASLTEFLRQRFEVNEELISLLIPFVQFDEQNVNLRKIHAVFGSDLDLPEFSCEFSELACQEKLIAMKLPDLVAKLSSNADSYPNVLSVLSRILAAKPHSADVERCISASNLLKTCLRSGLSLDTENTYLFIHHNLPTTSSWDPRSAVLLWLLAHRHRINLCQKAKSQPHFRHVFDEARLHKELEPEDECGQTQAESGGVQSSESTDHKQKAAKKRFF